MEVEFDFRLKLAVILVLVVVGVSFFFGYFVWVGFGLGLVVCYLLLPKFFAFTVERKRHQVEVLRGRIKKLEVELNGSG